MNLDGGSGDNELKILLVSFFFPPRNAVASLRPYSWAKWWSKAGFDVTVLTIPKRPRPSDMHMPCEGFRVEEIPPPFFGPYLRKLQHVESGSLTPAISKKKEKPWPIRFVDLIRRKYGIFLTCRCPDMADLWAISAARWACERHWDVVVSTGGPYSVHRVGQSIKKKDPQTKWILDWRDLWVDNHVYPGLPFFRNYEEALEKKFHDLADMLTTVSEPLADILRTKTNKRVEVIYNGFEPDEYADLPKEPFFSDGQCLHIVYTGTIYRGKQDPSPLFQAIAELKEEKKIGPEKVKILFAGADTDVADLACRYGVPEYYEFLGFLPRHDALRLQRDADVLLFLEFQAPGSDGILTGKLFEYLFAGKFILGIGVTKKTSAGELISNSGHGICLGRDVSAIKSVLIDWLSSGVPKVSDRSSEAIGNFSRKTQALKMLDYITSL